jgi:hypothetical protein
MAIISQNGVKYSLLSCQAGISGERQALSLNTNLKKQSQFPGDQMNISSFNAIDYDSIAAPRLRKNKASSNLIAGLRRKLEALSSKS